MATDSADRLWRGALLIALIALASTGLLTGCGGGDSSTSSNSTSGAVAGAQEGKGGASAEGGTKADGSSQGEAAKGGAGSGGDGSSGASPGQVGAGGSDREGGSSDGGGSAGAGSGKAGSGGNGSLGGRSAKGGATRRSGAKGGGGSGGSGGGGGSAGGGQGGGAAPASFISAADEICSAGRAAIKKGVQPYVEGKANYEKDASSLVTGLIVPQLNKEIDAIKNLSTPSDATTASGAILGALSAIVTEAEENPTTFIAGGPAVPKAEEIGAENGFSSCGKLL